MAITAAYEDSATISTTEYSLPNDANYSSGSPMTADGVYQLFLDLNALASGDSFELKIYEKVTAAGSQRLVDTFTLNGAQSKPGAVYPSLILLHGWDITLKKLAGTDRAIGWSIRQVA
jgi:hypothetical protein